MRSTIAIAAGSGALSLAGVFAVLGADEKKAEEKAGQRADFAGFISAVSDAGTAFTIHKTAPANDEEARPRDFKLILDGPGRSVIDIATEDKKLKVGMLEAVWLKPGSDEIVVRL